MLKRVHYYSILVDGSTDARSKEKEVIYILYVDPDTGRQRLRFFSLQKVEHATATDVLALIKKAFEQHGVDSLKEHTVGFGADGAAVNLGVRGGVSVLMKDDEGIDWLVTVHCASHRLELSIADALKSTVFSDINEMLQNVYSFYKRSPKKMVQLEGLGEALEMAVSMPVKASGTRWLEHKIRAMNWISKNYGLLIAHLNHLTEDESFTSADRQKFKGMYTKYRNAKYPLFVEYFIEILVPAAELSLIFQREKIDVVEAVRAVKKFFRIMNKLSESSEVVFTTGRVSNFFSNLTNQEEQFIYKDVNLSHIEQAKNSLKSANDDILSTIIECFKGRFDDITNTDNLFNALVKILDTEVYPEQGLDDVYGEDEVKLVIDRFCDLLSANGCDVMKIECEWDELKQLVVTTGLKTMTYVDVWAKLFSSSKKESLSNILHVAEILLVVPISNATLERMFSTMNRIHSDWRNCLGEKRVENLLRIWEEGPAPEKFDAQPVLARWTEKCATQRRPNVRPSGPRASGSKTKRKLPESQVAETVKKLLKDSESDTAELDVDMSSDKTDTEFESDCDLVDVSSDSDEFEN
jgi:hypothetical protein